MDIKKCEYKIIVDTREKKCNHILNKFDEGFENKPSQVARENGKKSTYTNPIKYHKLEKGLKTGDFSIIVKLPNGDKIDFRDKFIIERKASLSEICSNIVDSKSKDKEGLNRFARELKRAYENNIKLLLLIEVSEGYSKALEGLFRYDDKSDMTPFSFESKLMALKHRYNFEVVYLDKKHSARFINSELFYFAREYLKNIEL